MSRNSFDYVTPCEMGTVGLSFELYRREAAALREIVDASPLGLGVSLWLLGLDAVRDAMNNLLFALRLDPPAVAGGRRVDRLLLYRSHAHCLLELRESLARGMREAAEMRRENMPKYLTTAALVQAPFGPLFRHLAPCQSQAQFPLSPPSIAEQKNLGFLVHLLGLALLDGGRRARPRRLP